MAENLGLKLKFVLRLETGFPTSVVELTTAYICWEAAINNSHAGSSQSIAILGMPFFILKDHATA